MTHDTTTNWITDCGALSAVCALLGGDTDGAAVAVRLCRSAFPAQADTVLVRFGMPAEFSLRFPGNHYAFGSLRLERCVAASGDAMVSVCGEIHYGCTDGGPGASASAVLARFDTAAADLAGGLPPAPDIAPENYLLLANEYGVVGVDGGAAAADLPAPPLALRAVSAFLGSGESTLVSVPSGYRAAAVAVQAVVAPQAVPPVVTVGRLTLHHPYATVAMPGDSGRVMVIAVDASVAWDAPARQGALPAGSAAQVSVTLRCVPTEASMAAWRQQVRQALRRAAAMAGQP